MARSSVEILGGQLSGSIIQNAASEATLQEVVKAVEKMNKNLGGNPRGGGGGGGGGGGTPSTQSVAKNSPVGMIASLAGEVGEQIGNVLGAVGSIAGLISSNNQKLSSYTEVLNDQVIKKLPLVGGALGVAGDAINLTIGALDSWNDQLKLASQSGASFGNSILRLVKSAAKARLDVGDLVDIVRNNSDKFVGFGGTVTEGVEAFARYNDIVKRRGGFARETLMQIGFTSKQSSEVLLGFMDRVMRGTKVGQVSDANFNKMFENYSTQIVRITYLTGLNAQQQEQAMAAAEQDTLFQLKMNSLGTDERNRMNMVLREFSTMFPKHGAELFKSLFLGVQPVSEGALILGSQFGGLTDSLRRLQSAAKNGAISDDEFDNIMREANVSWNMGSRRFYLANQRQIELLSTVKDKNDGVLSGLTDIITPISRVGAGSRSTAEFFDNRYKKALKEMKDREGITTLLNSWGIAITEVKNKFIETILPYLSKLGEILEKYKIGDRVKEFGDYLGRWMVHYAPDITKVLEYLGSPEGREYLYLEIKYFLKEIAYQAIVAVKRVFYDVEDWKKQGIDEDSVRTALEIMMAEKEQGILDTGVRPLFRTPMPGADGKAYQLPPDVLAQAEFARPVTAEDRRITGKFGDDRGTHLHSGTDIAAKKGSGIYATHDGTIVYGAQTDKEGRLAGYGYYARIINSKTGWSSLYGHMEREGWEAGKKKFDQSQVLKGNSIGTVGSTGRSTGPHLHYELFYNGRPVDPQKIHKEGLRQGTLGVTGQLFKDFGGESYATLTGTKAVLTPEQMNNMVKAGGTISVNELAQTLNSNMSTLISLTKEKISVGRSQLNETSRLSGDIFAAI